MRLLVVEDEEKVVRFVTLGLKSERFAVDETGMAEPVLQWFGKLPMIFSL
jgi:DNA-binding response OmpR family regulator